MGDNVKKQEQSVTPLEGEMCDKLSQEHPIMGAGMSRERQYRREYAGLYRITSDLLAAGVERQLAAI